MDPKRFDTISKLFANRRTRRTAVGGGLGLAATSLAPRIDAQQGTPEVATPALDANNPLPSADDAAPQPSFLFVQPFDAGTWAPKDGEDDAYTLTLTGAAAQTIYFSDRPDRIVGLAPTDQFLDTLGFTPANPPNAALVADDASGAQDTLVIELLNPRYDGDAGTLTYDAKVLADYGEPGLASLARQQADDELAEQFGEGSLFIDSSSCGEYTAGECYQEVNGQVTIIGQIDIDLCWTKPIIVLPVCNTPCNGDGTSAAYGKACAEAYPDSCSYYSNGVDGWDCFARGHGI